MPKQVDKYDNERQEVLNKIFDILGINDNNKVFFLNDLDTNIDKQNNILKLEPDIKKYFICGEWSCFKIHTTKRKYLSIIKHLLKNMGYNVISTKINSKQNDKTFKTCVKYVIVKL